MILLKLNPLSRTTFYYTPKWYVENKLPEVTVVFRNLTLGELNSLNILYDSGKQKEYLYRACEYGIIRLEGIDTSVLDLSSLGNDLILEIATEIIGKSSLPQSTLNHISDNLDIYLADQLSSDSWKCDTCIKKRLQSRRNCGLIGEQDKDKSFRILVNQKVFTHCPIFELDTNAIGIAIEAYNIYKSSFLPDTGGWFDQTQTFCYLSVLTNNKFEEKKQRDMEKQLKAQKH